MNFMELLRYVYPLGPEDVVVDTGGYEGRWAENIAVLYGSRIHVYEPVPRFADICRRRFHENPKVTVHTEAVSDRACERDFYVRSNDSGFTGEGPSIKVKCADVVDVVRGGVSLLKLNVEGEEYRILSRLVGSGAVKMVKDVQVQFHHAGSESDVSYRMIHDELAKTHYLTWEYPFVWENWRRR